MDYVVGVGDVGGYYFGVVDCYVVGVVDMYGCVVGGCWVYDFVVDVGGYYCVW